MQTFYPGPKLQLTGTGTSHISMRESSQKPIPSPAIWERIFHGTIRSGGGYEDYILLVIAKMSCGRHSVVQSVHRDLANPSGLDGLWHCR